MGRSDETFPAYRVMLISIADPPEGWQKGARRCMHCDELWPNHEAFKISPCCGAETAKCRRVLDLSKPGAMKNAAPSLEWDESILALFHFQFECLYFIWNEGKSDAELYMTATEEVDEDEVQHELEDMDRLLAIG